MEMVSLHTTKIVCYHHGAIMSSRGMSKSILVLCLGGGSGILLCLGGRIRRRELDFILEELMIEVTWLTLPRLSR